MRGSGEISRRPVPESTHRRMSSPEYGIGGGIYQLSQMRQLIQDLQREQLPLEMQNESRVENEIDYVHVMIGGQRFGQTP